MNREYALAIVALVVVLAALTTLALSGAIADPSEPETDAAVDGHASLLEVTFAAEEISGETATLDVDSYLQSHGGAVENVTIVHRATNAETGLVESTTEREIDRLEAEHEDVVPAALEVPREGTHEIETFVYVDDRRTESVSHRVSGMDSLTPAYADTGLEFHRFGSEHGMALANVPAIEYTIASTAGDDTTLDVTSYLTNTGDERTGSLELEVTARQADSNIVADTERVDVANVDTGETVTPTTTVDVPDDYRYYLDATLWLDGTIVATDRAAADLRPESVVENASEEDSRLDAGAFEDDESLDVEADSAPVRDEPVEDTEATDTDDAVPGFTVTGAALALLATLALTRRLHT
ncbi:hypothetical protein D8Y22_16105 [Salinadaptatus halalkaliphilus]|uniref:DUF7490 domain-containing protein n=1 Tax=Salinadaptatus halalkaliphilus TaxID=2419781 RepID=A0A4S3TJV7_9EURY|nr:hypothetical protein [Salinadaptatus halalkaliphilus]THE63850.1 hypothetical protein D8Y22_16105 [Salinadaptatus halalkaliphilus]